MQERKQEVKKEKKERSKKERIKKENKKGRNKQKKERANGRAKVINDWMKDWKNERGRQENNERERQK